MRPDIFKYASILTFVSATLLSCEQKNYTSQELSKLMSTDSRFVKTIELDKTILQVTYKPVDLLVHQELPANGPIKSEDVLRAREKYKDFFYFVVSLSYSNREFLNASSIGLDNFNRLLPIISFRMGEVVNLTTSNLDTVSVTDYVYNRTFGIAKSTDLLFVFDKSKAVGQDWIQINFDEFGLGIGKQSVRFKVSDLENAPHIFKP